MTTEQKILRNIEQLEAQIDQQYELLDLARSKHKLTCTSCKKKTQVQNLLLIEIYEDYTDYDEPLAQRWSKSNFAVPCPKCNHINLFRSNVKYFEHAKFINDHLSYFKQRIPFHESTKGSLGGLTTRTQQRWNQILSEVIKDKT